MQGVRLESLGTELAMDSTIRLDSIESRNSRFNCVVSHGDQHVFGIDSTVVEIPR